MLFAPTDSKDFGSIQGFGANNNIMSLGMLSAAFPVGEESINFSNLDSSIAPSMFNEIIMMSSRTKQMASIK